MKNRRNSEEQYIDSSYVRQTLRVSRTKAFEIIREIRERYPDASLRIGRLVRVRKDAFDRWVSEHCVDGEVPPLRRPRPEYLKDDWTVTPWTDKLIGSCLIEETR